MGIVLRNATFINWKTLAFSRGDLYVDEGPGGKLRFAGGSERLAGSGLAVPDISGRVYTELDCTGMYVTRSFAIGHHHVYSALARGMPGPQREPGNFREILKYVWWALDKSLDEEMIKYSALVTAMEAAMAGSTFVIDHHASPSVIKGSLEIIANAFDKVGVGHLLCYEASDRDGIVKARKGMAETARYLAKRQGLVGLHASFTVGSETLERAVDLMQRFQTGVHVHVAEDLYDQEHCLSTYRMRVMKRWYEAGLLNSSKTILVHGLHLDDQERELFRNSPCWLVQNTESNLNNRVGHFNGGGLGNRIMLGTDGMHSDMFLSAKAAYFSGKGFDKIDTTEAYQRFRNPCRYLIENGFSGAGENNLVVLKYDHPTDFNQRNFAGHFIYGMHAGQVRHVLSEGKLIVKDREILTVNKEEVLARSREHARRLWARL